MYRSFKQVRPLMMMSAAVGLFSADHKFFLSVVQECPSGIVNEATFKRIYSVFFPYGDVSPYAHCVFRAFDVKHSGVINFEVK